MSTHLVTLDGTKPRLGDGVFLADGACIIGDCTVGSGSSVWFHAVLRGDLAPIVVGQGTNIQDGAVVHVASKPSRAAIIGSYVTIGHRAIVHAATIDDETLVGMGAVVLDGAHIPSHCIVGAGALVSPRKTFPAGSLILGNPARAIRRLTDQEIASLRQSADDYMKLASTYLHNSSTTSLKKSITKTPAD